jgi:hypothetical protein
MVNRAAFLKETAAKQAAAEWGARTLCLGWLEPVGRMLQQPTPKARFKWTRAPAAPHRSRRAPAGGDW